MLNLMIFNKKSFPVNNKMLENDVHEEAER